MKTFYIGFKGKNNTSYQLIASLNRPCLFLTNSFPGIAREIGAQEMNFDSVIMIGVDKTLKNRIRFEGCAQWDGEMLASLYDMELLTHKCASMGIAYTISHEPTKYLCNAAYWHMLKKFPNTVFIHIPSTRGMTRSFMQLLTELLTE